MGRGQGLLPSSLGGSWHLDPLQTCFEALAAAVGSILFQFLCHGPPRHGGLLPQECQKEGNFCNLTPGMTVFFFFHILFFQSKSLGPDHIQGTKYGGKRGGMGIIGNDFRSWLLQL